MSTSDSGDGGINDGSGVCGDGGCGSDTGQDKRDPVIKDRAAQRFEHVTYLLSAAHCFEHPVIN